MIVHVSPEVLERTKKLLMRFNLKVSGAITDFGRLNKDLHHRLETVHRQLKNDVEAAESAVEAAYREMECCSCQDDDYEGGYCGCADVYQQALRDLQEAEGKFSRFERLQENYRAKFQECRSMIIKQDLLLDKSKRALPAIDKKIGILKDYLRKVPCTNEHLEGSRSAMPNVSYQRRDINIGDNEYEVVVPIFDYLYETEPMPAENYTLPDRSHFANAMQELQDQIEREPDVAQRFTPAQLVRIRAGRQPADLTWHHAERPGVLQLVDSVTHSSVPHTGGRAIWGGGQASR